MPSKPPPETVGFFSVSFPVNHKHQKKTWWMRIGSATLRSDGSAIGRIEAVPVGWDGSFYLFPVKTEDGEAELIEDAIK